VRAARLTARAPRRQATAPFLAEGGAAAVSSQFMRDAQRVRARPPSLLFPRPLTPAVPLVCTVLLCTVREAVGGRVGRGGAGATRLKTAGEAAAADDSSCARRAAPGSAGRLPPRQADGAGHEEAVGTGAGARLEGGGKEGEEAVDAEGGEEREDGHGQQ
jgi:hypothetical protein